MVPCLQCGKCCLGLDWTFNFGAENEDPNNPSQAMLNKAVEKMNSYGLYYHKFKSAEFKDGCLSMTFSVGVCQHLSYEKGKAHCKNYNDRSTACRNYLCENAKKAPIQV